MQQFLKKCIKPVVIDIGAFLQFRNFIYKCISDIYVFVILQVDRRHGKRDVLTPNIKSESWKENFSSVFTLTKKKGYSSPEC